MPKISFIKTLGITILLVCLVVFLRAELNSPAEDGFRNNNLLSFKLISVSSKKVKPKIKVELDKNVPPQIQNISTEKEVKEKPFMRTASRLVRINNPKDIIYKIENGDTLQEIAYKFYGSYEKYKLILRANPNLNPKKLRAGNVIKMPGLKKKEQVLRPTVLLRYENPSKRPYIIKENDVLSKIAEQQLGSSRKVRRILEMNPGLNPDKIHAGQKIFIPTNYNSTKIK